MIPWSLHGYPYRHLGVVALVPTCALSKQGHRLLSSLNAVAGVPSASVRLIRKFVASSSKAVTLNALSHLLSSNPTHAHLSTLALPMYTKITEAPWFEWNPKLVADLIALLHKQGHFDEAETLTSDTVMKLGSRLRDITLFYCNVIDSHSKHHSKRGVFDSYARLQKLLSGSSSSSYANRRVYESMIKGLCSLDLPREAETLLREMDTSGLKPSVFEFRCVVHGYGRSGMFTEMRRLLCQMEDAGFPLDTVCSNMILSSYGAHRELSATVSLLQKMKDLDIPFSIRTYNSVLNSCPNFMSLLQDVESLPLSIEDLIQMLHGDETLIVKELKASSFLRETLEWDPAEGKLDLHGMHLGSAYLIMLQWVHELRSRFREEKSVVPTEITVVCGSGKHSTVRGESPVKALVKQIIVRMKIPMRIDRKNSGCFVGRGKAVNDWFH